ncbi:MAG: EamA family transporter RarD [Dethiobacter sp.]|nr:EamA family transporter RarD [Dethiobacter sp.]
MIVKKAAGHDSMGILYGICAYTAWGILPLYWKLLDIIPALEILAHRILWSFIFISSMLLITGGWPRMITALTNKKNLLFIFLSGFLISLNWFTYIFAVNSNHVIEASMGYYISPLVVVLLGVTIFKEKLTSWQCIAITLAAIGVLIITVQYGKIPWISLALAFSFALYGLTKKLIMVDSITTLALETLIVMPIALIYIISKEARGIGALGTVPLLTIIILMGSGIVTASPLVWFARGIQSIRLSMMGFLQYIAPSISLFLGIFVFKEHFSLSHFISFSFIWAGLIIFTLSNFGVLVEFKSKKTKEIEIPP